MFLHIPYNQLRGSTNTNSTDPENPSSLFDDVETLFDRREDGGTRR